MTRSKSALLSVSLFILLVHFFYYPKWSKKKVEATLSWDVSGYYMYLPAIFIYKDIKQCTFLDSIVSQYKPTFSIQQAYLHEPSGNYVMKYSMGQAVLLSPAFFVAHLWACISDRYPPDGFSLPYQLVISMWSLMMALIGLIFLRLNLLEYFDETSVGLTLLGLVLGSNYLNYSAIDGAMTHSSLFTLYAILVYAAIHFYKQPSYLKAVVIGLVVGLMTLTRPTELVSCLIPLLWGMRFRLSDLKRHALFMMEHKRKYALAVLTTVLVGSMQVAYWYVVTGDLFVYSYKDQGFSWLDPHLTEGLFSFKCGWLLYTPIMAFALVGCLFLFRTKKLAAFPILVFLTAFIYLTFAWDIWWYGGSLGQRAMVQSYAILAFPLGAFMSFLVRARALVKWLTIMLMIFCSYVNLWFTHQAHKGGLHKGAQTTKAYFLNTFLTYKHNPEHLKLLDGISELYDGDAKEAHTILRDTLYKKHLDHHNSSAEMLIPSEDNWQKYAWIRVSADFEVDKKEWSTWKMTHFTFSLKNEGGVVKHGYYRVQRYLEENKPQRLFLDIRIPDQKADLLTVGFDNSRSMKEVTVSNLVVELFGD